MFRLHLVATVGVVGLLGAIGAAGGVTRERANVSRFGSAKTSCTPRERIVARGNLPRLEDVAALSASDVWMVGTKQPYGTPVIGHWDGRRLRFVQAFRPTVKLGGYAGVHVRGEMTGVAASGPNDVWAVGVDGSGDTANMDSSPGIPVVMHWNRRHWARMRMPRLRAPARLDGIAVLSPRDVWAVGQISIRPLVEHWDGKHWRVFVIEREGHLYGVDASSSRDVWAVGADDLQILLTDPFPLAEHWDGEHWREGSRAFYGSSDLEDRELDAIDVVSGGDAWTNWDGDIRHWNGRAQQVVRVDGLVSDIQALTSTDVWAVGLRGPGRRPYLAISHVTGTRRRVAQSSLERVPDVNSEDYSAPAISAVNDREIWLVGARLVVFYAC